MRWCDNCRRHAAKGYQVGHCAGSSCTRCPWSGCPCTHTGGCDRGYIPVDEPADELSLAQVRRCGACQNWAETLTVHPPERIFRAVS